MEIINMWRSSSVRETVQLGRPKPDKRPKGTWQKLWRKLGREKRNIFRSPARVQASYDAFEYSQNFDQGTDSAEPDNLPRSFSARFADPSRMSRRENTDFALLMR